jgi:hypothetical protein
MRYRRRFRRNGKKEERVRRKVCVILVGQV